MKCDELKVYKVYTTRNEGAFGFCEGADPTDIELEHESVCLKSDVDKVITELKDKCQMHDFFWEGCGFAKRGFKNTIAVSEAFNKLEAENAEIKAKLEDAKASAYADSVDAGMRERRLKQLQMYREHLDILKNNANKMIWHPYKDCGDAPKVAEYQKDVFLCKVQMYMSDNDEPVGMPVYNVLLCGDNGIFYGYRPKEGDCYNKVIAWTEIIG